MMINHITLIGRLTADPELRYTSTQKPVTSATLAIERFTKGEKKTDFIDIVLWGDAEKDHDLARDFKQAHFKGQYAAVEGRLTIREWEDKDGNKRKTPEVVVSNFVYLQPKKDAVIHNTAAHFQETETAAPPTELGAPFQELMVDDDNLPF